MKKGPSEVRLVIVNDQPMNIHDVYLVAIGRAKAVLDCEAAFVERIAAGSDFVDELLAEGASVYGVNTGYGDSCTVEVTPELIEDLPHHLFAYHGCGAGRFFDEMETRAILMARLASLCKGYSGVSVRMLKQLALLLEYDILPRIPAEGSVGASGDLTPLSYVAAVLCGEREVMYQGEVRAASEVFTQLDITPIRLRPKEGLAIMNGTAVMTGLACLAWERAKYVSRLAARITAGNVVALLGNACHFELRLFELKPHAGQLRAADWIREDIGSDGCAMPAHRLQDRYSLRCAPHVIGVLEDTLDFCQGLLQTELNSSNDNPLIDPFLRRVYHGGHFYGGHVAMAMDTLKTAVANVADLLDRQMALAVDARFNHGLPPNLSGAQDSATSINHGLKALQISVSAWTAEALKNTMPASVFSRSTECHNQDKVSMGTIAARDAIRCLELTEQVVAGLLITVRQGLTLRARQEPDHFALGVSLDAFFKDLCAAIDLVEQDRRLDLDLTKLVDSVRQQVWTIPA